MQPATIHSAEIAGYRITAQIGTGGMGDVYKAYNTKLNRLAAIKVLQQKELAERFANEASIQSSVCHPNIARLYEFVYFEGTPCIIMEYVEGQSLDAYIHQKGKLSSEETERILLHICSALGYLHDKGIIHRDIKPQNFKIQPNGTVKMLDFGIAKDKFTPQFTQHGFVVGTMQYMAPEQFLQQASIQSDIWSLGVMTYEMVTGYLPFETTNPITLRSKIAKGSFTNPKILVPQLSENICAIIDKCLRIQPGSRPSAKKIEALLTTSRSGEKPVFSSAPLLSSARYKKLLVAGGALFCAMVIALLMLDHAPPNGPTVLPVHDSMVTAQGASIKTKINVLDAENAFIVFPDGTRRPVPYDLEGADGENFDFTLQAEGYADKQVKLQLSPRRKSYEYHLEKTTK